MTPDQAQRLAAAVRALDGGPSSPLAVVDLEAFDANAADLVRRAGGTPVRVASKSVRMPALLRRALGRDGFAGVLAYTLAEALHLVEDGVTDDVLVAYPSVDRAALTALLASEVALARVALMVDDVAHLDLVDAVRAEVAGPGSAPVSGPVRVAVDVDAGLRAGRVVVGPRRSPLHDADAVVDLVRTVLARPGLAFAGVMTYEGQVAGVPDDVPTARARSLVVRGLKAASRRQLRRRRRAVARGLQRLLGGPVPLWNAGGSGSVESTVADPVVTEVAAGSGLFVPTLFDHYRSFDPRPAAFFALPVTRRPGPGVVTVHGGGLVASGPAGADRLPSPCWPPGLALTGLEGAGEVQTPVVGDAADDLAIGDLVWFRHAKSGELFEHVREVHLLEGPRFVDVAPTYRGLGLAF